jgi:hypothetical protein
VVVVCSADAEQNGGDYEFLIQNGSGSVPLTQRFWDDFFAQSKEIIAGLEVYEQDCEQAAACSSLRCILISLRLVTAFTRREYFEGCVD